MHTFTHTQKKKIDLLSPRWDFNRLSCQQRFSRCFGKQQCTQHVLAVDRRRLFSVSYRVGKVLQFGDERLTIAREEPPVDLVARRRFCRVHFAVCWRVVVRINHPSSAECFKRLKEKKKKKKKKRKKKKRKKKKEKKRKEKRIKKKIKL